MLEPRYYQKEAHDILFTYWQNNGRNGIIVLPTGAGKSLVLSMIAKTITDSWPGTRILIVSHVREIVKQCHDEMVELWPDAPIGVYSAGLNRRDFHDDIIFASVQSIQKHVHKLDPPPEIVIIDEAHRISTRNTTQYHKMLTTLAHMYPQLRVVGLTATPYRMDTGWLHTGEGAIFNDIIYEVGVSRLIDDGYLCPVTCKHTSMQIDTSDVKHTAGEFNAGDLERVSMRGDNTKHAVKEIVEKGKDRKKWLIFASGVKHAEQIHDELIKNNITSEVVTGDTDNTSRDRIVDHFRQGEIRALVNVSVFTTGFNVKDVDLIAMLRATESNGLYYQIVGRGLRKHPNKNNCLVLDFVGNVMRLGPIDAMIIKDKSDKTEPGIPPSKICPECESIIHAAARECPDCGFIFPDHEIKVSAKHIEAPLLKKEIEPVEFEVSDTIYSVHKKAGRPDSVRVDYYTTMGIVSEWVFPSSNTPGARFYYDKFCAGIGFSRPYPENAEEFVEIAESQAERIKAKRDGKYWRVLARKYMLSV